jgi:hypothetical protein
MSAELIETDWRYERAASAIRSGAVLDFKFYAEEFETDEEEVIEIFHIVACELGARIYVSDELSELDYQH